MSRRKCAVEVSRDTLSTKEKVAKGWAARRVKRSKEYRTRRH